MKFTSASVGSKSSYKEWMWNYTGNMSGPALMTPKVTYNTLWVTDQSVVLIGSVSCLLNIGLDDNQLGLENVWHHFSTLSLVEADNRLSHSSLTPKPRRGLYWSACVCYSFWRVSPLFHLLLWFWSYYTDCREGETFVVCLICVYRKALKRRDLECIFFYFRVVVGFKKPWLKGAGHWAYFLIKRAHRLGKKRPFPPRSTWDKNLSVRALLYFRCTLVWTLLTSCSRT